MCLGAWRAGLGSAGWCPPWLPTRSLHQVSTPGGRILSQKTQKDDGSGGNFHTPISHGQDKMSAMGLSFPFYSLEMFFSSRFCFMLLVQL